MNYIRSFCAWWSAPAFLLVSVLGASAESSGEITIDTVVASVDGKPITLQDLARRLPSSGGALTSATVSSDPQARQVLDALILERLVEEEASSRRIKVTEQDVDSYIDEVARRNQMSRSQFESALTAQRQDLTTYRDQVRFELYRSRLMGQLVQGGAAVSKEDIDEYLREHPSLTRAGSKIKLRQIVVARGTRAEDEVTARIEEIRDELSAGQSFESVATKYSEGPEASEGGLLGVVAEEDLSPAIFEAILGLDEGQVSEPIATADAIRLFQVEKRFIEQEKEVNDKIRDEVRTTLTDKKLQEKLHQFFTSDLPRLHTIDRKI